jgi:DNA-binding transcriptional LysR family regulator
VELRHLATFVAVAEEQGFSRAADRLKIVQSAVSATIRNLEREWGVTLFHRTTHRVELSAEGRELLPVARDALRAAEAVDGAVDELHGGLRGTIRLGIMQTTLAPGGISVAAVIAAFRATHPSVTIEIGQRGSARQADAVREGELDLAFVGLPQHTLPGLRMTPLTRAEMHLACHPEHRLAGRTSVELGALQEEPFADMPPEWGIRIATDRAFAAAGLQRKVAYEINDLVTVADFVRHGLAVAILAPVMFAPDPRIAFVPIRHHAPEFVVSLVEPAHRPGSPAARAFAAAALTHAAT